MAIFFKTDDSWAGPILRVGLGSGMFAHGAQDVHRWTHHPAHGPCSLARQAQDDRVSVGWGKQHGTMRKTKHRGLVRVAADFLLNLIGYNLVRIPKLLAQRG